MTDTGKCPAFGYDCEYVATVEAQAAEIQRLKEGLLAICQETTDSFIHDYAAELLEDD